MEIEIMGRAVKITDVKAIQKGFLRPAFDCFMVYLSTSSPYEVGPPDYIFAVSVPAGRYGKEEFLAEVTIEAEDVIAELAEIDTSANERRRQILKRQEELDALVDEIKSEIGLPD